MFSYRGRWGINADYVWYHFIVNAMQAVSVSMGGKSFTLNKGQNVSLDTELSIFFLAGWWCVKTVQATRQAGRNSAAGVVLESSASSQGALALNGPHRFSSDGNGEPTLQRAAPTPTRWRDSSQDHPTSPIHLTPPTQWALGEMHTFIDIWIAWL